MSGKPTWTILLVDAQPISLSTLKNQLEYYQYNVLTASDARSCITLFQERQREIVQAHGFQMEGHSLVLYVRKKSV